MTEIDKSILIGCFTAEKKVPCILCLLQKSAESNNFTIWCVFTTGCLSILSGINMLVVLKECAIPVLLSECVLTWYQSNESARYFFI